MYPNMLPIVEVENGALIIKGYCERRFVHTHGLKHTTSLIVPVLSYEEGRILTIDKCEKYINDALALGETPPTAQMSIDIAGGHLEYSELTEKEKIEGIITEEIMRKNAIRKVEERLLIKVGDDYGKMIVNPSKLRFIGTYECSSAQNNEVGYVYSYEVPTGNYVAEIIGYTREGEPKKILLQVMEFMLSELSYMNDMFRIGKSSGYKICDGLSRILDTGDELYTVMNIKKSENGKGAEKKPRKFNIGIEVYPPVSSDSESTVFSYRESFFGTAKQADDRARELVKQRAGELNVPTTSASYFVEEL